MSNKWVDLPTGPIMNILKPSLVSCVAALALFGCDLEGKVGETSLSTTGATSNATDGDSGGDSASGVDSGIATESESESESDSGIIPDVGGEVPGETCDPFLQDCPAGEACYPAGDVFQCGIPSDSPGGPGSSCEDHFDCEAGNVCAADGLCASICQVGVDECDAGVACAPWLAELPPPGYEDVGICGAPFAASCHPNLQDCAAGSRCMSDGTDGGFVCAAEAAAPALLGEGCADQAACGIGLACVEASYLVVCAAENCCTDFCDGADPGACGGGAGQCLTWATVHPASTPGAEMPGFEDVGACGVGG